MNTPNPNESGTQPHTYPPPQPATAQETALIAHFDSILRNKLEENEQLFRQELENRNVTWLQQQAEFHARETALQTEARAREAAMQAQLDALASQLSVALQMQQQPQPTPVGAQSGSTRYDV